MRRAAGAALLVAGLLPAQVRVRLQGDRPSELQRQVLRLAEPASAPAAMAALFAAGAPAVPLLADAAQRDDALSLPAVRVLGALGGIARPARPELLRLARGSGALATAAALAAAAIGERDGVLVADWSGNRVVELDPAGSALREVTVHSPWSVQPVGGDHLLVCCHGDKLLLEIGWDGKEIARRQCKGSPIHAQRLADGSTWIAENQPDHVLHIGADGSVLADRPLAARTFRVLWNDELVLLCAHALVRIGADGRQVGETAVPDSVLSIEPLASGLTRLLFRERLVEFDPPNGEHRVLGRGGYECVALRDGRLLLGDDEGLSLLDAKGDAVWRFPCHIASCIVARLEAGEQR
jgi:hypothetical protein